MTRRIVINACFGGFGLSHEGMLAYAAYKGLTLYTEERKKLYTMLGPIYWTVPPEQRAPKVSEESWHTASLEDRKASNAAYARESIDDEGIARDDPALVRVVEELGAKANGEYAELRIVEIPDDVEWQIEEYDGSEHVAEVHRTWR